MFKTECMSDKTKAIGQAIADTMTLAYCGTF